MFKPNFLFILSLLGALTTQAQTYLINSYNGQTVSTCSGTIYDSGGSGGNYSNNQNYSMTVVSSTPGMAIQLVITYNTEEDYDYLYVYNGTNTSAPLMTKLHGSGSITLFSTNVSNALHVKFTSDGSNKYSGFSATISCADPPAPTIHDCLGARPVCGSSYTEGSPTYGVNSGQGYYLTEIYDVGNDCHTADNQPGIWYIFTVQTTGSMRFTIDPVNDDDDYDWAMFNLSNHTCADLASSAGHAATEVSSNTSGETYDGPTGINSSNSSYDNSCGGPGDEDENQWNVDRTVTAGQQYVLYVANYEQTNDGYTITFNQGSSNIIDIDAPYLSNITSSPACGQNQITFNFNERVLCSSVSASDFNVTGPGGPYSVTNIDCNSGAAYSESFTITLNSNLTSGGSYSLNLSGQVDDACGNAIIGNSLTFTVNGVSASASVTHQVDCYGGTNGTATVVASGGTPAYTYQWSTGGNSASVSGLSATSYNVTVSDAIGVCQSIQTVTVTQPNAITSTFNQTNVNCFGSSTGSATVNPSNGTPGYTYLWSASAGGGSNATASGLAAGTHTVTVTDAHACIHTNSVTITQPNQLTLDSIQLIQPLCYGGNNGQIIAHNTHGGTAPYTTTWSNGGSGSTLSGLSAGNYFGTITDANGCSITNHPNPFVLGEPTAITITPTITDATCFGGTNGSVLATPSGGTSGYTYAWGALTGGQTTPTASNLGAGTYNLTVTDAHSCTTSGSFTVGQGTEILVTTGAINSAHCGLSDGSATVSASGGTGTLSYSWSTSPTQTGLTVTGVSAASYTVTVSDINSCNKTHSVSVPDGGAPSLNLVSQTEVSCYGGSNGTAQVNATGGSGTLNYSWSSSSNTSNIESGLSAGPHTVSVTDGAGCVSTLNIDISEPDVLSASISSQTSTLCFGSSNGTATVDISGGTSSYTTEWSTSPVQNTVTATGLTAGPYTVTITDAHLCTTTESVTIAQPMQIAINNSFTTPTLCYGESNGTAGVDNITGGTGAYSYLWNTTPSQTDPTASGLSAGPITVTVSDVNNCTAQISLMVSEPSVLSATTASVMPSCYSGADGIAVVNVSGGTVSTGYTYLWDNNAGNQTNDTAFSLAAGSYNVTVQDDNACSATYSVNISDPTELTATTAYQNVSCFGGNDGRASISPTGGTSPYTYLWSESAQTNDTIFGLIEGMYDVTVYDANLCAFISSIQIIEPSALSIITNAYDVLCNGGNNGQITSNVSGGTNPYTFEWSNGATSSNITESAGIYSVTVTDNMGCVITQTDTISEPTALAINFTTVSPNCGNSDGSASANVSGGVGSYQFEWTNLVGNDTILQTADSLVAGNYNITVYDGNGCSLESSASLTDLGAANISIGSLTHNRCYQDSLGTAQISIISGGTAPFNYTFKEGSDTLQNGSDHAIDSLWAGSFAIIVKDNLGCIASLSFDILQNPQINATMHLDQSILCTGEASGAISVNVNGGTAPYQYHWSFGSDTDASIDHLPIGPYWVTVTDDSLCVVTRQMSLSEPNALSISLIDSGMVTCNGSNSGYLSVQADGGTPIYNFTWSNSQTGNSVSGLSAGDYQVTIHDQNGCELVQPYNVSEPNPIVATISVSPSTCSGANGSIALTVTGGTGSYSFEWAHDNTLTNSDATGLISGIYTFTITDSLMCVADSSVQINNSGSIGLTLQSANDANCFGTSTGSAEVLVVGGVPNFTYIIRYGSVILDSVQIGTSSHTFLNLGMGNYQIEALDGNGCSATTQVSIDQPTSILANANVTNVNCFGQNNAQIQVNVNGGTPAYQYLWSHGATSQDLTGIGTGTYSLTISDSHSCTKVLNNLIVSEPSVLSVSLDNISHNPCHNDSIGQIEVSCLGGTHPYNFIWNNHSQDSILQHLKAGQYNLTVTDAHGCTDTLMTSIVQATLLAITDSVYIENHLQSIDIVPVGGTPSYQYEWSNGEQSANLSNLGTGLYQLTVTDFNGCKAYQVYRVDIEMIIPSVITPNADGKNDRFNIVNIGSIDRVDITIFNRWGDLVFNFSGTGQEYQNETAQWDGTYNNIDLSLTTFVYVIDLHDGKEAITGTLTIVK